MKTKIHNQFCKIYGTDLLFNKLKYGIDDMHIYLYDKIYAIGSLILDRKTNVLWNQFEEYNWFDVIVIRKHNFDYLSWKWKENEN